MVLKFFLSILLIFSLTSSVFATAYSEYSIWLKKPAIDLPSEIVEKYQNQKNITVHVKFLANTEGKIEQAEVVQSSGDDVIDRLVVDATLKATVIPYQENGEYSPVVAIQPIVIQFPSKCFFKVFGRHLWCGY